MSQKSSVDSAFRSLTFVRQHYLDSTTSLQSLPLSRSGGADRAVASWHSAHPSSRERLCYVGRTLRRCAQTLRASAFSARPALTRSTMCACGPRPFRSLARRRLPRFCRLSFCRQRRASRVGLQAREITRSFVAPLLLLRVRHIRPQGGPRAVDSVIP